MDQSSAPKLMPIILLLLFLVPANTSYLSGSSAVTAVVHNLHCVNDFVSTISCSLSFVSAENATHSGSSSYQLLFKWAENDKEFVCVTLNATGNYSCSVDVDTQYDSDGPVIFMDTDVFEILLCPASGDRDVGCVPLVEEFEVVKHIQPSAPCCLAVLLVRPHNSSQYHFSWKCGYEKYLDFFSDKVDCLMYQLHFYTRGGNKQSVNPDNMNLSVDAQHFLPDTEYVAAVRSSPNQDYCQGQWSEWSREVHWKTRPQVTDSANTFVSGLRVIVPLCVVVLLLFFFLCFAPVKKWKRTVFIPTPAPYFQTLYSDHQGDFKSWVVTSEKRADVLTAEETLQIDALTQREDVHQEDHPLQHHYTVMKGSLYSNMSDQSSSASLLGLPYAVSATATSLVSGSPLKSQTPSSGPGSPAGDSGCWFSSDWSVEKDAPWYNNEYCTLNAFLKSHTAEQHGSSCDQTAADRDYQNESKVIFSTSG